MPVPKYLNFATLLKNLSSVFMLWSGESEGEQPIKPVAKTGLDLIS
jgi:hypothetical protein